MDRPFQTDPGDEQPDPETIRQTRTEAHLTLAEFAAMIGIYDLLPQGHDQKEIRE